MWVPSAIVSGSLVAVLLPSLLRAQSFEVRHQRDVSTNPTDLHFRIATEGGIKTFHRGERIPIVIEFWSDSPEEYKLNGATNDRIGRLHKLSIDGSGYAFPQSFRRVEKK